MNAANPKDPLTKVGADASRALFEIFGRASTGFPVDAAIEAGVNTVINAIRQSCATRAQAEAKFDEIFGRGKAVLVDHYDSVGRKKGIFPFDQVIAVPRVDFRN